MCYNAKRLPIAHSGSPDRDLAPVGSFVDRKAVRDCLLDQRHVRDKPYRAPFAHDILKHLQNLIERSGVVFRIKAAEAFINENGVGRGQSRCRGRERPVLA